MQLVTDGVRIGSYRPDDAPDELRIVTSAGLIPVPNFVTRRVEPKVGKITRRNGVYAMAAAARPAARPVARQPVSR